MIDLSAMTKVELMKCVDSKNERLLKAVTPEEFAYGFTCKGCEVEGCRFREEE